MTPLAEGESPPRAGAMQLLADRAGGVLVRLADALAWLRRRPVRQPAPYLPVLRPASVLVIAGIVVALVAVSMLLVDPSVPGLRLRLPRWLVLLSERITDLGYSGVILWPLGIAILYLLALMPGLDAMGRRVAASVLARVGFLFLAIAPVGLGVAAVKHLIGRARPHAALHIKGPNPELTFHWLGWKSSFASFPSGHSTTTLAAAVALGFLFPRARAALLVLAVPVVATRLVLGSHYPSDVIAGAALGALWALLVTKAFAARRVVFAVAADGRILPMAGPSARRLGCLLPFARIPAATAVPAEEARQ